MLKIQNPWSTDFREQKYTITHSLLDALVVVGVRGESSEQRITCKAVLTAHTDDRFLQGMWRR